LRCAECHGADFSGGTANVSCMTCHADGPTACNTCHGQPPQTGAHATHAAKYACARCHPTPASYRDAHLHTGPALLQAQCNDCHGAANPTWVADPAQAQCGSCHGLPPPGHADNRCAACHPGADAATHANGQIDLGDGSGTCTACHGQPPTTGAHTGHVAGTHRLAAPLGCAACHPTPTAVGDPGHIDHAPPATLATDCAHCHGQAAPTWVDDPAQAACGTCHGIPPQDGVHWAQIRLTDCATCHPQTIDPSGAIIVRNGMSTHINGVVDVR
jgi:hypothetical protein